MEDPNLKNAGKIAEAASKLGNSDLGSGLGLGLVFFGLFGAIALVYAAIKWDGHLHDRKGCVQLQEVQGKVYKVDTCTGKTEFLELKGGGDTSNKVN